MPVLSWSMLPLVNVLFDQQATHISSVVSIVRGCSAALSGELEPRGCDVSRYVRPALFLIATRPVTAFFCFCLCRVLSLLDHKKARVNICSIQDLIRGEEDCRARDIKVMIRMYNVHSWSAK